jgi:hypothetical protein
MAMPTEIPVSFFMLITGCFFYESFRASFRNTHREIVPGFLYPSYY